MCGSNARHADAYDSRRFRLSSHTKHSSIASADEADRGSDSSEISDDDDEVVYDNKSSLASVMDAFDDNNPQTRSSANLNTAFASTDNTRRKTSIITDIISL